jgi:hypothetical protein
VFQGILARAWIDPWMRFLVVDDISDDKSL